MNIIVYKTFTFLNLLACQINLALALINFFPGIDYILMLPYAVSLHKIFISTGQLSDEKNLNGKKCCIHQPFA